MNEEDKKTEEIKIKNITNKKLYKWDENIQKKYNIHYKPIFEWKNQYQKYCNLFKKGTHLTWTLSFLYSLTLSNFELSPHKFLVPI